VQDEDKVATEDNRKSFSTYQMAPLPINALKGYFCSLLFENLSNSHIS